MQRLELEANGKKVDLTDKTLDVVYLSEVFWELYGDTFIGHAATNSAIYTFDGVKYVSPALDADTFSKVGVMVSMLSNGTGTGILDKHIIALREEVKRLKAITEGDTTNVQAKADYDGQVKKEKEYTSALKLIRGMGFTTKFIQHVKEDRHSTKYLKWAEVSSITEGLNFGGIYYKFGDRELPLQQPVMVKNTGKLITHGTKLNIPLYEGDSDVPYVFNQKLEYAMPDQEEREYFQTLVGSLLHPQAKTICFAEGPSNTGKSALMRMIMNATKPYLSSSGQEYLFGSSESSAGALDGLLKMRDITCCVVDELEENQKINKAKLKRVTGGMPAEAKQMHGQMQNIEVATNVLIITNELPDYLALMDDGFKNRTHITPHFQVYTKGSEPVFTTPEGKPLASITEVESYIRDNEMRAILGWAVEGLKKYISSGCMISIPASIEKRREEIFSKAATGDVSSWLEDTGTFLHPTLRTSKLRTAPALNMIIKMVKKSCNRSGLSGKTVRKLLEESGAIIEVYMPGTHNRSDKIVNWCWRGDDNNGESSMADIIDGGEAEAIKMSESSMQFGNTVGSATISQIMRGRVVGKKSPQEGYINDDLRVVSSSIY